MEWTSLGHATWLCEVAGLRILFDPLLEDAHYGGVFEVTPPRELSVEALRPDFVVVSHRHADHFDVASLRRLAELDPDTVVVSPDALVIRAAARLGFRAVREVAPGTRVELDGATLLTTPSAGATVPECGIMVASSDGVVWNQVDTSVGTPAQARAFVVEAARALGRSSADLVSLLLARWQPLLEVEATTAGALGFPLRAYAAELEHAAAIGAGAVVPSSAGVRHARPFAAMNRLVYPVTESRFLRDAAARMPDAQVFPCATGAVYRVDRGRVTFDADAGVRAGLVALPGRPPADDRDFRPLDVAPLVDPNVAEQHGAEARARIDAWVRERLAPSLPTTSPATRFLLEVVSPTGVDAYSIHADATRATARVELGTDPDWDVRCAVAASMLADVIAARRHWGELLLSGSLRGASRAYEVGTAGVSGRALQPLFVYYALDYEQSVERAVEHALAPSGSPRLA